MIFKLFLYIYIYIYIYSFLLSFEFSTVQSTMHCIWCQYTYMLMLKSWPLGPKKLLILTWLAVYACMYYIYSLNRSPIKLYYIRSCMASCVSLIFFCEMATWWSLYKRKLAKDTAHYPSLGVSAQLENLLMMMTCK